MIPGSVNAVSERNSRLVHMVNILAIWISHTYSLLKVGFTNINCSMLGTKIVIQVQTENEQPLAITQNPEHFTLNPPISLPL